ncbi:Repulsive guidance molecule A [Amphibalanus amphitrite]|uniref:Repulsive guidance molecule A n=1 Tax=Amphibalanus amphitrite TaxID=1232801 RepID=A0A6A4W6A8_AMPAM|nr:Repulsive guidance molecule A [Amphibalanus amphitrite]
MVARRAGARGRLSAMQFLSPFDPGIRAATLLLLLLLSSLLLTGLSAAAGECRSEHCSREYERSRERLQLVERPEPNTCRLLGAFSDCMRKTKRACRGHLYFHTNMGIVERTFRKYDCRRILAEAAAAPPVTRAPPPPPPPTVPAPLDDSVCSYRAAAAAEPVVCSLFGDPHVRTFGGEFQTCRLLGAWPLLDNAYLAAQVTNSRVGSDECATAPTKLTVIVKHNEPCTGQLTYEARANESLPRAFVDGAVSSGARSQHSAAVTTLVPGLHVAITVRHINATLEIRRVAGHLSFSARLPRELAEQPEARRGLQLCSRGCLQRERVDYRRVLSSVGRVDAVHAGRPVVLTAELVTDMCRQNRVIGPYLDACVFDALSTGKTAFMEAAREAQRDLERLLPQALRQLPNRTRLGSPVGGAPGRPAAAAPLLAAAAALWVLLRR